MEDLLGEFVAETREMAQAIAGEVVAWEADPSDRSRLDAIFRFVHTVKGNCGFLKLPRLERLSHAAEDGLAAVREGRRVPDADFVSAILAILDRIGEIVDSIERGESLPDEGEKALIAALAAKADGGAPHPPPAAQRLRRAPRVRTVRLPVDLLDRMMAGITDLVLARNEVSRGLRHLSAGPEMEAAFQRLSASVVELREAITRTRMQRIDHLFAALPRIVRDVAQDLDKKVELVVEGADVELDREMIDLIRDPLIHMVRNAIDHGIEPPDERAAAGKPSAGLLLVSARQSGNRILIEIADDGRGLDPDRLLRRAVALGLVDARRGAGMTEEERLALIFEPGFSTSETVTALSGRGVGMDVVRSNVERIGGSVLLERGMEGGLRIVLRVPLTLTIISSLTVGAGDLRFALPRAAIREIVHDRDAAAGREGGEGEGRRVLIGDRALPLVDLETVLGLPRPTDVADRCLIVLQGAAGAGYALGVARLFGHEELVIKPASPPVTATGLYAGAALPDSGVPILLLDPSGLAAMAGISAPQGQRPAPAAANDDGAGESSGMLLFHDLDDRLRAIPLAAVDRVDEIATDGIRRGADGPEVVLDGAAWPIVNGDPGPAGGRAVLLRLADGGSRAGYLVRSVVDVVDLPAIGAGAPAGSGIAGLSRFDGRTVEIVDPRSLLSRRARPAGDERPLCRLEGEDHWTREVLRPLIEAAGYRVEMANGPAAPGAADPAVVIVAAAGNGRDVAGEGRVPVVRLRRDRVARDASDDSIYRHDRAALLDRLAALAARRGR